MKFMSNININNSSAQYRSVAELSSDGAATSGPLDLPGFL
jgi:hypothetical protein